MAVAYVRCSTDEQEHGPKAQRDAIERWCTAKGLRLLAVHEDLGVSGATNVDERPGLMRALNAVEVEHVGVLVVAKRDRIARDVVIAAMVERLVCRAGAQLQSADGAGNGEGAEAELMRGLIALFAQYERALIRTRTKAALASKKLRGQRVGQLPFGHDVAPDGVHLVPVEEEQRVIDLAIELRRGGLTLRGICDHLTTLGHRPRGRCWYPTTVARMLRTSGNA